MAGYQFHSERIHDALQRTATTIEDVDFDETWDEIVDDGSTTAFLIPGSEVADVADALARVPPGPDPRATESHHATLDRLRRHDDCPTLLHALRGQLFDAIGSIKDAFSYCCNDISIGRYGELELGPEEVLDALRPSLALRVPAFVDDLALSGPCDRCASASFHEDQCEVWDLEETLGERREAAFASHLLCEAMGNHLIRLTRAVLDHIEAAALTVHPAKRETDYGTYCHPAKILPALTIAQFDLTYDPRHPATIAAATVRPLADQPYCDDENDIHMQPHRACRMLIS